MTPAFDPLLDPPQPGGGRRIVTWVVGGVLAIALATGLVWMVIGLFSGHGSGAPKPPKISLLPSTPPPPPPPPKEEKKPEPPKEQKEMKMEQPVPQKVEAPPSETLKMEGAAGDGPGMFGAGKVTNEDLSRTLGTGPSGGGGPPRGLLNPFNTYAQSIKAELQRMLSRRSELRRRSYSIEVDVWVDSGGRMTRSELLGTTEDGDTDTAIRGVLAALPSFSEAPPQKMPQPIRLRIVTSGRG